MLWSNKRQVYECLSTIISVWSIDIDQIISEQDKYIYVPLQVRIPYAVAEMRYSLLIYVLWAEDKL